MIEQRSQPNCLLPWISENFHIRTMPVTVENQIIHCQHLIDCLFPTQTDAEIHRAFIREMLSLVKSIQRDLAFTALLKILGRAEPGLVLFLIDQDSGVDQLIGQMLDPQNGEKPIHDDFIDTFMPDDTRPGIVVGQLVIGSVPDEFRALAQLRYVISCSWRMICSKFITSCNLILRCYLSYVKYLSDNESCFGEVMPEVIVPHKYGSPSGVDPFSSSVFFFGGFRFRYSRNGSSAACVSRSSQPFSKK